MARLTVLIILLSVVLVSAFITVPPMRGTFDVLYKYARGPGFVVAVGVEDVTYNITLFTDEGFNSWMKKYPGTAIYNGMLRKGDFLIIETPPGRYVLAVYPVPLDAETKMYGKSYSEWAPVGVMSLPREPTTFGAVSGYFEVRNLKVRGYGYGRRPGINGTSIQLNTIVVLELADGGKQYYFMQNAILIRTDEGKYRFVVNIFNHTSKDLSSDAVKGRGNIYWNIYTPPYYGYNTREERLSLPFSGFLIINVTAVGDIARIDFGYNTGGGVVWYDSVMIKPYVFVKRTYILAGPVVTPIYTITSLELVLCGYGVATESIGTSNILSTPVASLYAELDDVDVRLALLVWDGGGWRPAPRLYNFGFNTGEAVSLNVETRLVNGTVHITRGTFKPMLLAEEPPTPDVPPPDTVTKPQADGWLAAAVAAAVVLLLVAAYRAGSALIDRLAGRLS